MIFFSKSKIIFSLAFILFVFNLKIVFASSSSGYVINSDSVSFGAGLSASTNFTAQDTLNDFISGDMDSSSFTSSNGYVPMAFGIPSTISVTYPSSVAMSGEIKDTTGGQGNGQFTINVVTDSSSGYSLSLRSNTSPALKSSGDSFANYSPAIAGTPDFTWTVGTADSFFGFTPEGTNIVAKYKDNGISCNTGALDTVGSCWDSILTTNKTISNSSASNSPSGTDTVIKLRDEAGATVGVSVGTYSSTLIVTAVIN